MNLIGRCEVYVNDAQCAKLAVERLVFCNAWICGTGVMAVCEGHLKTYRKEQLA